MKNLCKLEIFFLEFCWKIRVKCGKFLEFCRKIRAKLEKVFRIFQFGFTEAKIEKLKSRAELSI
jgi:hypothetical protein